MQLQYMTQSLLYNFYLSRYKAVEYCTVSTRACQGPSPTFGLICSVLPLYVCVITSLQIHQKCSVRLTENKIWSCGQRLTTASVCIPPLLLWFSASVFRWGTKTTVREGEWGEIRRRGRRLGEGAEDDADDVTFVLDLHLTTDKRKVQRLGRNFRGYSSPGPSGFPFFL